MPAKMPGKFDEGDVLFANVIQNTNRFVLFAGQPDDIAPRPTKLALKGLHLLHTGVEVLLEKLFEDVHEYGFQRSSFRRIVAALQPQAVSHCCQSHKDNIEPATPNGNGQSVPTAVGQCRSASVVCCVWAY